MGCVLSSNTVSKLRTENEKLLKIIEEKNTIIQKQTQLINLVKLQQDTDFCVNNNLMPRWDNCYTESCQQIKTNKNYKYIVFSGGSVKGICFAGALLTLEKLGIMYDSNNISKIKGYGGSSAGAIVAALMAVGYTPTELKEMMISLDTTNFFDDKPGFVLDTINFLDDWGVCPGNYFDNFLAEKIKQKTGNADCTFNQLYNDKGVKLVIVTTNQNCKKSEYFYPNAIDTKLSDIPIRKAVRMSISMPFVFEPVEYNNDVYVDGGVLDNFPLHVFDGEYPGEMEARLNLRPPNPEVIGFNIVNTDDSSNYNATVRKDITSLSGYAVSFIDSFLAENQRRLMTPAYWIRTVNILTKTYSLLDVNLTNDDKLTLIKDGVECTTEFFS